MRKETNMTETPTYWTMIDSPLGPLLLTADEEGISGVIMDADIDEKVAPSAGWVEDPARFEEAHRQLEEYFAGQRTEFDLPLRAAGTPFQHEVWAALQTIPSARSAATARLRHSWPTRSFACGRPSQWAQSHRGDRAVPSSHRSVRRTSGYGGGLPRKRLLLDLEAGLAQPALATP